MYVKVNYKALSRPERVPFKPAVLALAVMTSTAQVQAGKISTNPDCSTSEGFGGWNLGNVDIVINEPGDNTFDETCGTYTHSGDESFSYYGDVKNGEIVLGQVLAKDWPVGEPPGIKVIHDDQGVKPPKPQNCIMATSYLEEHLLNSADPQQVTCSGPYQSHKRYKLAMLPTTVSSGAGAEEGIDVVFNVEQEDTTASRSYQVYQKINNWTGQRLAGFTIQVGVGMGEDFTPASSLAGVGVANLSLSVPGDIWASEGQLANFSTGLFGPPEPKHDKPAGYFDPARRAGFSIEEYPNASGATDTLHSGDPLASNYADVPPGAGAAPGHQFGPWLPNNMLPQGIFEDTDGNPATDAELKAWYGYNPALPGLGWMKGAADGFAAVPGDTIEGWGSNLFYTMGAIDDLVNVGLNYVLTVGDVSGFPGYDTGEATFTIRITPLLDQSGTPAPAYNGSTPDPILIFASSDGVVEISPEPTFEVGALLTARVGDADWNQDSALVEAVTVEIQVDNAPPVPLVLIEQGENRGVFAASLPDEFSNLEPGQTVTVTYTDDGDVEKTASTTAVGEPEPPVPAPAEVDIIDLSVPESLYDTQTRVLSVSIQNSRESESLASGTVILEGTDGSSFNEAFSNLKIGGKQKFNFRWSAMLTDPTVPETVSWTATVDLDEGTDKFLSGTTNIEVKVKGKDRAVTVSP